MELPRDACGPRAIHARESSGKRHDAATLARDSGLFVAYVPSMRNGHGPNPATGECEDRGNAIFSTLPARDLVAIELPMLNQRRVALLGTITGHTGAGHAWSLHAGSLHFDVWSLPAGRARQAAVIASAATAPAAVVGGDLNLLPWGETAHQILTNAFPQTMEGDRLPTHVRIFPNKIDFQFYRLPSAYRTRPYRRVESAYNSDHNAQAGWIGFSGTVGGNRRP
jgi:endonuclease/exonuclease/phosphatase family metal-dependent hydrolase